jgi:2-methylisocitrate lyase-like PEP mutase family enzyme
VQGGLEQGAGAGAEPSRGSLTAAFLEMHRRERPLLLPNAWDVGSAKLLVSLGFEAVATTSSGFAATLGRLDGEVSLDEALVHAGELSDAVGVPVTADLENGYGEDAEGVAESVRRAIAVGLAGCSIEDSTGEAGAAIYGRSQAVERVAAAAEAAHAGPDRLLLTARAENHLHGRDDLDDTIARLQAYGTAGADVLYAPGLRELEDIRRVVAEVSLPVNVLAMPGVPPVPALTDAGVKRISVGGAFAFAALAALVEAATELRDEGTYGYWERTSIGSKAVREAFARRAATGL